MRNAFIAAPPSTRSSRIRTRESRLIASTRSRDWNAIDSSAARARCARVVPRVNPRQMPRASGLQYGAPSPAKAGTSVVPPASGTERAIVSLSSALSRIPSPSRSHWIAAPPMKTLPSSA